MKFLHIVLVGVTLIAGCAARKETIPFQYYNAIASVEVAANQCVTNGMMDYQTAAATKNLAAQDLNSWKYDPVVYQTIYSGVVISSENKPFTKQQCDNISIGTAQREQRQQQAYQQQQIQLQQQQQFNQSMQNIQNSLPKTTYCNQIGWQTVCNTY